MIAVRHKKQPHFIINNNIARVHHHITEATFIDYKSYFPPVFKKMYPGFCLINCRLIMMTATQPCTHLLGLLVEVDDADEDGHHLALGDGYRDAKERVEGVGLLVAVWAFQ